MSAVKKSMNARLEYVRKNNENAASALSQNSSTGAIKKTVPKELASTRTVYKPKNKTDNYGVPQIQIYNCICNRQSQVIECRKCKMLLYGRISQLCRLHPNVTYLLDFFYCPYCTCSKEFLTIKNAP